MVFPGYQGGPLMHVIAAKAVAFKEAMEPAFREYQQQVLLNARAMAHEFIARGIDIVSGGTDNHLFLVDLRDKGITGKALDAQLDQVHITVNKNAVPNDPQSPFVTSGIRVGTPSITTRGFKETESKQVAGMVCDLIENIEDDGVKTAIRNQVADLCSRFPMYER
jgi:glycine hydroxymethyltransferase